MRDLVISIGHVGRDFEMLANCLRSVYAEDAPDFSLEVWIVYNGPPRPGFEAELRAAFPQIARVGYEPGPLGFCRTHNLVLEQARARYLLILDDDTVVAKGTLSGMVAYMDANPRIGMAGCKTLNPDGSFQRIWGLLPTLGTELRSIWQPAVYWPDALFAKPDDLQDVPWLNGSFHAGAPPDTRSGRRAGRAFLHVFLRIRLGVADAEGRLARHVRTAALDRARRRRTQHQHVAETEKYRS
jgi:hypothetical protein